MLKRMFLLAVMFGGSLLLSSLSFAQGSISDGVCCNHGVSQIPAGQQCMLLHQVGPEENLHMLSAYYYGNARGWRRIYNLNKKQIRNPNKIIVGQVLRIQIAPCWTPRFPLDEFLRIEAKRAETMRLGVGERKRIHRITEVVETKVSVIIEEEEEVKPEEEERERPAIRTPKGISPPTEKVEAPTEE